MTIAELMAEWAGGPATLYTREEDSYVIHVDATGCLRCKGKIPHQILSGTTWSIRYPVSMVTPDVIEALTKLNPDAYELMRPEWNSWCWAAASDLIYAVARALNHRIEKMEPIR